MLSGLLEQFGKDLKFSVLQLLYPLNILGGKEEVLYFWTVLLEFVVHYIMYVTRLCPPIKYSYLKLLNFIIYTVYAILLQNSCSLLHFTVLFTFNFKAG